MKLGSQEHCSSNSRWRVKQCLECWVLQQTKGPGPVTVWESKQERSTKFRDQCSMLWNFACGYQFTLAVNGQESNFGKKTSSTGKTAEILEALSLFALLLRFNLFCLLLPLCLFQALLRWRFGQSWLYRFFLEFSWGGTLFIRKITPRNLAATDLTL